MPRVFFFFVFFFPSRPQGFVARHFDFSRHWQSVAFLPLQRAFQMSHSHESKNFRDSIFQFMHVHTIQARNDCSNMAF
jgi:hypothetical protein